MEGNRSGASTRWWICNVKELFIASSERSRYCMPGGSSFVLTSSN